MGLISRNKIANRFFYGLIVLMGMGLLAEPAILLARAKSSSKTVDSPASAPAKNQKTIPYNTSKQPLVPHKTFPAKCDLCHVAKRWDVLRKDFKFDHFKETGYRLEGAHAMAACLRCHNDRGDVKSFSVRGCGGCHEDPHKSSFGVDCKRCHDQNTWKVPKVVSIHANTRFPLNGAHLSLRCEQCHLKARTNDFSGANPDCFSCHADSYKQAPKHVELSYPHTCEKCHDTDSYKDVKFDHSAVAGTACAKCHLDNYTNATSPVNHVAENLPKTCEQCHNTKAWQPVPVPMNHSGLGTSCEKCHMPEFNTAASPIDHKGLNLPTTCASCHQVNNFTNWNGATMNHSVVAAIACQQCHINDYNNAKSPNHVANNFAKTCESCHNTNSWGAAFDHSTIGATPCQQCHIDKYNSATTPNHVTEGLPKTCEQCHNTTQWQPVPIPMNHTGLGTSCGKCHMPEYQAATSPVNHAANKLPTTCESCHVTTNFTDWNGATMNHNVAGVAGVACVQCHLADYTTAKSPNHVGLGYSQTCQQCHTTANWTISGHPAIGGATCYSCHQADYTSSLAQNNPVAANGTTIVPHKNVSTTCENCHNITSWTSGTMSHTDPTVSATACSACHAPDYNTAAAQNAVSSNGTTLAHHNNMSTSCKNCHTTSAWIPANMSHTDPTVAGLACSVCHAPDYNSAAAQNAVSSNGTTLAHHNNMSTSCKNCHTTSAWIPANMSHTDPTVAGLACSVCHTPDYNSAAAQNAVSSNGTTLIHHNNVSNACNNCHLNTTAWTSFNMSHTDPIVASLLCKDCHFPDWQTATVPFNHPANNVSQTCQDCHKDFTTFFNATGFDHTTLSGQTCYSCHAAEYTSGMAVNNPPAANGTTVVPHTAVTTLCESCHNISNFTDWTGAHMDHSQDKGTACSVCHTPDYNSAPAQNALAANGITLIHHNNVSTLCNNCHLNTATWAPANMNHTDSRVAGTLCAICHLPDYNSPAANPANHNGTPVPHKTSVGTSCNSCHLNTSAWTSANMNHLGNTVGSCGTCHLNDWTTALTPINHPALNYPKTCEQCHVITDFTDWNGATVDHTTLGTNCENCHMDKYNTATTTSYNHPTLHFPTHCNQCHTNTTDWTVSTFNHNANYPVAFPLRHHTAVACNKCHDASNVTAFNCLASGCHGGAHHQDQNPIGCATCHNNGSSN